MRSLPTTCRLTYALLLLSSYLSLASSLAEAGGESEASLTRLGARVVQGRWTGGNLTSAGGVESGGFLIGDLTGVLRQTAVSDLRGALRPLVCSKAAAACRLGCSGHVTIVLLSSSSLKQLRPSCPVNPAWSRQRFLHGNESLAAIPKLRSLADCLLPWGAYDAATGASSTADCQMTAFVVLSDLSRLPSQPRLLLLGSEQVANRLRQTASRCPEAGIDSLVSSRSAGPFAASSSGDVLQYLSAISQSWSGPDACASLPGSSRSSSSSGGGRGRGDDATGNREVGDSNPDSGGAGKSLPGSVIFGIMLSVCLFLLVFCFFATRICPSKDSSLTIRARAILRHRAYSLDRRTADIHLTQPVPDPERPSDLHLEVPLDDSCRFLRVGQGSPGLSPEVGGGGGRLRLGSLTKSLSSIGSTLFRCGSRGEVQAAAAAAGAGACSKQSD